ncbi:MAG: polysaccharide biosynthesis tyrosine autokinase [Akkermansiaceae bacterium]|nr:polysaccharide biosynthesis tyrosine autokinase [Armatimonadota bacterium]
MNEQSLDLNEAPSISLREYGDILRRRRAIILQAFLFVLIVGIIWTAFQSNVYRTSARLLIEPTTSGISLNNSSDPLNELFRISGSYNIDTQVELLQTPDMLRKVADKVKGGLPSFSVDTVPGTQIIQVTAESSDQNLAADATNTLLETYKEDMQQRRDADLTAALKFAKDELEKAKTTVNTADRDIAVFKRKFNVVELEQSRKSAAEAYDIAKGQYSQIEGEITALRTRIASTQSNISSVPAILTNTVSADADALVQSLQLRIADAETSRRVLRTEFQPGNDRIVRLDNEINDLQKRLTAAENSYLKRTASNNPVFMNLRDSLLGLNTDAVVLNQRLLDASKSMKTATARIAELPAWERKYNELIRTKESAAGTVASSGEYINNLAMRMQARPQLTTIIDRAQVPQEPISPNRAQNIIFAGIIGLFLGLGLALLQELFDDRINSADEAERVLKLPSLGHIPHIEEEGLRLIRDISTFSPLMEAYRTLRTNINFAAVGNQVRSMVVTSSVPAEGKSTTCANLAMAMAMDGKKVIIVDADLRRPSQHHLFKVDASPGLTDLLIGSHTIDEVLRPTSVENVFLIPAGSPPPNPAELLGSAAMGRFLAEVETRADVILLDTPPALAVADATVLAARTDGALLVIGYGDTKKTSVKRAKEMLARGNANILGTVLNRMDGAGGGYYYYGKYYMGAGYAPYAPNSKKGGYAPVGSGKKRSDVGGYAPAREDRKRIESGQNTAVADAPANQDES